MWRYVEIAQSALFRLANNMTMAHWGFLAAVLVTVGVICMRGYGSRKDY